jgi:hypothetical protein
MDRRQHTGHDVLGAGGSLGGGDQKKIADRKGA